MNFLLIPTDVFIIQIIKETFWDKNTLPDFIFVIKPKSEGKLK